MFIPYLWGKVRELLRRRSHNKNKDDFVNALEKDLNIITIAYGNPSFSKIEIHPQEESFYLSYGYFTDRDYEHIKEYIDYNYILKKYNITNEEFFSAVKVLKNKTYYQFENKLNGKHFNGDIYGILTLNKFIRSNDKYELPEIRMSTYNTDYFTMNTMSELLKYLSNIRPKTRIEPDNLIYFRNSLGVNVLLILPSTNEIVMIQRSKDSSYTENNRLIYPSVVETISIADETNKIDIEHCVYRGILEELGLYPNEMNRNSLLIYSMFYESNYFQDNFALSISADDSITILDIRNRLAKDRMLEVENIITILNTKSSIERFISQNKNSMQYQTIYLLEIYKKMTF